MYYAKLAKPLAADEFIDPLRREMTAELEALQQALPSLEWLKTTPRGGQITLSPLDAAPEPRNRGVTESGEKNQVVHDQQAH